MLKRGYSWLGVQMGPSNKMAYRVTIKSTRAIHSQQRGCLSVENTNGSLLEASLIIHHAHTHWCHSETAKCLGKRGQGRSVLMLEKRANKTWYTRRHHLTTRRCPSSLFRFATHPWYTKRSACIASGSCYPRRPNFSMGVSWSPGKSLWLTSDVRRWMKFRSGAVPHWHCTKDHRWLVLPVWKVACTRQHEPTADPLRAFWLSCIIAATGKPTTGRLSQARGVCHLLGSAGGYRRPGWLGSNRSLFTADTMPTISLGGPSAPEQCDRERAPTLRRAQTIRGLSCSSRALDTSIPTPSAKVRTVLRDRRPIDCKGCLHDLENRRATVTVEAWIMRVISGLVSKPPQF